MRCSILVVEDSPTQAEALRLVLERNSFEVRLAPDGEQGLALLAGELPTIVISDVLMPGIDGFELCRRVRADERLRRIPVILLTALSDSQDVMRALECGADIFVSKPYSEEYLVSRIRYVLDNPPPRVEERQKEVNVRLQGNDFSVTAGRRRIVDLLLSTYEAAMYKNRELTRSEEELLKLNEELELRVQERTARVRSLARELTQAEERERRQLAAVLHDHLQQLLVGAKLGVQLAQKRAGTEELTASLGKVTGFVNEAIALSRSLMVELSPPVLHEGGIVPAVRWLARWMKEKYGLSVEVSASAAVPPDEEGISTILYRSIRELLFNVVKHAGVKQAHVELGLAPSHVRAVVSDVGAGFDPLKAPAGDEEPSFGLLSVTERLNLVGGQVHVDSAPGRGTRVTLLAPRPVGAAGSARGPTTEPIPPAAGGEAGERRACAGRIRVLVADDLALVRAGLVESIRAEPDMEVVGEAADGLEAVDMSRRLRPDVILMDLSMPRLSGLEATERIVASMPGARVIELSMHEKDEYEELARKAGAAAYVMKDGPPERLIATIRVVCGRPEAGHPERRGDAETGAGLPV